MYSVNAEVPPAVARLARGLASDCITADARDYHTLLVKRIGDDYETAARRARDALAGLPPFEVRVTGVEAFDPPTSGTSPVAYLAVESPGIREAHERLCEVFDPVPDLEGEDYTPHVTVARDGDAGRIVGREIEPIPWTVERLDFWDNHRKMEVESVSLPA